MKTYSLSEFKAKCPAILRDVQMKRQEVLVTLRGTPIAKVSPVVTEELDPLSSLRGTLLGCDDDIVTFSAEDDWEALTGDAP